MQDLTATPGRGLLLSWMMLDISEKEGVVGSKNNKDKEDR